jgi:glutathione S-transferase
LTAADITALVTVDYAAKAINLPLAGEYVALKRWYDAASSRFSAAA